MKNNNALFYTCSLIEYIGRTIKQRRSAVVKYLGANTIKRIYKNVNMDGMTKQNKQYKEIMENI